MGMDRPGGLVAVVLLLVPLGGCSVVTRTYQATVLEAPIRGNPVSERWGVHLRLDRGEIAGAEEIHLGFDRRALLCEDGSDLAPSDLEPGTVVRFVREGDGVDASDPPGIAGRDIRAEC